MNPLTAGTFIFCGISLLFLHFRPERFTWMIRISAGIILLIGLLKSASYLLGFDFHIDSLLFAEKLEPPFSPVPNRLAPNTALCFALSGMTLLAMSFKKVTAGQILSLILFFFSLFPIIGYWYNVPEFYRISAYIPMAFNTACSFCLLGFAVLFLHPDHGIMLCASNNTMGGLTARILLPVIIVFSLLIGYYTLRWQHAGWYEHELNTAILIITSIFFYVGIIWGFTYYLFRTDIKIISTKKKLQKTDELIMANRKLMFQNEEKEKREAELIIANKELAFQNKEKGKRAEELNAAYNELIKSEDELLRSENQVRNFAAHLNQVLEDERSRIAREIHDEFGQQFAGLKIGLSLLKKTCAADKVTVERINDMSGDVDHIIQSLRKVATELRPGILDSLGLVPSIEWLAKEFAAKRDIKCKLELNVEKHMFEKNLSTCIFRICQEALTNVSKHAKASEVIISLSQDKNELILKIADNGKGFCTENPDKPFSMGLVGMRERAHIIGADLKIFSKKDLGTTVLLTSSMN
jgi:signal transduction histidine kinase